jgi:hypothetical protein
VYKPFFSQTRNITAKVAFAFLNLKIHNASAAVAGDQIRSSRFGHSSLGVVAGLPLSLACVRQMMAVGKPQLDADDTDSNLRAEKVRQQLSGELFLANFMEPVAHPDPRGQVLYPYDDAGLALTKVFKLFDGVDSDPTPLRPVC